MNSTQLTNIELYNRPSPTDSKLKYSIQEKTITSQFKDLFLFAQFFSDSYYKAKAFLSLPIADHFPPKKVNFNVKPKNKSKFVSKT